MFNKFLSNNNLINYLLGLVIFFISLFLIPNLGGGFTQIDFDTDTPTFANYARNLLSLDLSITKGLAIHAISETGETVIDSRDNYSWYADHPPTLYWMIAGLMKVFGVNLFSARIVSILASFIIALYIFKSLSDYKYSNVFAFFILIGTPIYIEHGLVPGYQTITLMFLTISIYYFTKFIDGKRQDKKFLNISFLFWFFALICDWPAYFFAIPLFIFFLKHKNYIFCFFSIILPLITYIFLVGYDSYVISGNFDSPLRRLLSLASSDPVQPIDVTIKNILKWFIRNYRFVLIFFLIGLFLIKNNKVKISNGNYFFLLSFAIIGTLNIVIFYNWAGTHSFWSYYYLPSIVFIGSIYVTNFRENLIYLKFKNILAVISTIAILSFANFYNINKLYNYKNVEFDKTTKEFINFAKSNESILLAHSEKFYWWHGHVVKWYIDKRLTYYDNKLDNLITNTPEKFMIVMRTGVFNQIDNKIKKYFTKSKFFDVHYLNLNKDFILNQDGLDKIKIIFKVVD